MLSPRGTSQGLRFLLHKTGIIVVVGKTVSAAALGRQPMEAFMDTQLGDPLDTGGSSVSSKVQRSSEHSKCLIVASLNPRGHGNNWRRRDVFREQSP